MRNLILAMILFLAPSLSIAGHGSFLKYGLGFNAPDQNSLADIKLISLGYQGELFLIDQKFEFGGWADNTGHTGSKNGGFGSWSIGLDPRLSIPFYINWFSGVALITSPDALLGSCFQFTHDFGVGFRDNRGVSLGFYYKHFSNAGIVQPNRGRDFFGTQLQIPW